MKGSIRIIVSGLIVALAIYLLDWEHIKSAFRQASPDSFLFAVLFALLSVGTIAARWIVMVGWTARAPLSEHWRIYLYSTFLNSFTPANIGGDVYRVVALKPWVPHYGISRLVSVVAAERVIGLGMFFAAYLLSLIAFSLFDSERAGEFDSFFFIVAGPIGLGLLAMQFFPVVIRWISRFPFVASSPRMTRWFQILRRGLILSWHRQFYTIVLLSALAWLLWAAAAVLIARDLGAGLSLPQIGIIISLTELIRAVPISFQGIGVREGVFAFLTGLAGGSPEVGFAVATIVYATMTLCLLACAPLSFLFRRTTRG